MEWTYCELESKEKRMNSNGYYEVDYPEHPYAVSGKVLYHRLVMENHVMRFLDPETEVVHHVNENKTCNYIWNLWLTTPEEHTYIHRLGNRHDAKTRKQMSKKHQQASKKRKRGPGGTFV